MKKKLDLPLFDPNNCPEPVLDLEPDLIDLYWKAWELAWDHIKGCDDTPVSPFMDEAFCDHTIWIWDTCFMVHFCKYAPKTFPGIQSFDNFYAVMHDGASMSLKIQHPDNPPLFAWVELEYAHLTGDISRLHRILVEKQYLQKHFDFIEQCSPGRKPDYAVVPIAAKREPLGYRWSGTPNGMDNTPRGRDEYDSILWLDLLAQQALAADCIAELAGLIEEPDIESYYRAEAKNRYHLLNQYYWNEEDGIFYDILCGNDHAQVKVKTPASYWPLLAGACSEKQAKRLDEHARNPRVFGGEIPWPTVERGDPEFHITGRYWRGAVWLPTAYMAIKGLDRSGFHNTATQNSINLLRHMAKTYAEYEPQTIWECYNPILPEAAMNGRGNRVRPDFCGWSAVGPISLLIEDVLGFHKIDALERKICWNLNQPGRHGIRRLRFGDIETDILYEEKQVKVKSDGAYTLEVNKREISIQVGEQTFEI